MTVTRWRLVLAVAFAASLGGAAAADEPIEQYEAALAAFLGGGTGPGAEFATIGQVMEGIDGDWIKASVMIEQLEASYEDSCSNWAIPIQRVSDHAFEIRMIRGEVEIAQRFTALGGARFAASVDGAAVFGSMPDRQEYAPMALLELRTLSSHASLFRPSTDVLVVAPDDGAVSIWLRC